MEALPGGPADYLRSQLLSQGIGNSDMSVDEVNRMVENYVGINPDATMKERYIEYMTNIFVHGDLGTSLWYREPVTDIYAEALPWTIFVMGNALVLTFITAIVLGAIMAYKEGSRFDMAFTTVGILFNAIPYYIMAILLIYFFAVEWTVFPLRGRYPNGMTPEFTYEFIRGTIYHAVLPVASVYLTTTGIIAISMRGNSIRVLGEDYLRVARLRGLPNRTISTRYVGRNAVLPLYTSMMIALGSMFGGSVILEQVFLYRGMGFYLFEAVKSRDYTLVTGGFMIITAAVLIGLLIAEMTYGLIDPRASEGGASEQY